MIALSCLIILPIRFSAGKNVLPERFQKWLKEDVVYIITDLEKQVFLQLRNDRERDLFMGAFWKQRDPTEGTLKNEFKTEHFRRINHANHFYGRTTPKPGWRTSRGRIYIILGEPNDIQRFEGKSQVYNSEVWFYQGLTKIGLPPGFNLVFFQKGGIGEYGLYSPLGDGPQALLTSYYGDPMDYIAAYRRLREFEPGLSEVSLSLIPGEGNISMGRPSLSSDILIQKVESAPTRQVKEKYAQKFLEFKDVIEVEYSANYMDSDSQVKVFKAPGGGYYVHYAVEPERLSVNQFEDKYYSTLKLNGTVTDQDGRLIHQFEKGVSLEFNEEQIKNIYSRPVSIRDLFFLIPGRFKLSVLVKNEVSKEFTSLERELFIPSEKDGLQMSSLLIGYKKKRISPAQGRLRPFQLGNIQIYSQAKRVFLSREELNLVFQIHGLNPSLRDRGEVRYVFSKGGEEFQSQTRRIKDNLILPDFFETWFLKDFPPAHYNLDVSILLDEKVVLSQSEEFDVTHLQAIARPWYYNKLMPGLNDPIHVFTLGSQLLNAGKPLEARAHLENAFRRDPDSLDFALSLAKCDQELNQYRDVVKTLSPFFEKAQSPSYEIYMILSRALMKLGEWGKALDVLNKAVARFGVNTQLLNVLGACYSGSGNTQEALTAWEKSLEIDPDQTRIRENIQSIKEKKRPE